MSLLLPFVIYPIYHLHCLYRNILLARSTGLKYVVVPINEYNFRWYILGPPIVYILKRPIFRFLPFLAHWIKHLEKDWNWRRKYSVYEEVGEDVFLVVCATRITLWTADADVTAEIIRKGEGKGKEGGGEFAKPTHLYGLLDIFGKNVLTTVGDRWRMHRKVVLGSFGEKNNR